MKKIFMYALTAMVAMLAASCTSCHRTDPVDNGLNYDSVVIADYDYIASQYNDFKYYETDVEYDSILCIEGAPVINYIKNVYQYKDTCIQIEHWKDGKTDTTIVNDYWLECMPMNARNAVNYDSCMNIISSQRGSLRTRAMTFRRVLAPPFPENGQYIFGVGVLVVDSKTGEIIDWNDEAKESGLKCQTE